MSSIPKMVNTGKLQALDGSFQWKSDLFCNFFCFFKLWKQQGVQGIVYLREKKILFWFQKKDFAIEKAEPAGSKAGNCFNLVNEKYFS